MATAINGRAHPISLDEDLSTGTRLASGWIRRRPEKGRQPLLGPDYVGQASRRYRRHADHTANLTDHQSPITSHGTPALPALPALSALSALSQLWVCPSASDWSKIIASGDDLS